MKELSLIQSRLKAPKGQYNEFGNYKYRSCEDILEAVKPLIAEIDIFLTITDEVVLIGERYFVKATAKITSKDGSSVETTAYAELPASKKGMDLPKITGSSSSYARKYALNGLFCIDDTKDADANEPPSITKPSSPPLKTDTIAPLKTAQLALYEQLRSCLSSKEITRAQAVEWKDKFCAKKDLLELNKVVIAANHVLNLEKPLKL